MPKPKNKKENIVKDKNKELVEKDSSYLVQMNSAPKIGDNSAIVMMLPLIFFTAFVIMIMRMMTYQMTLAPFFGGYDFVRLDFFSYGKMIAILICAGLVLLFLMYQVFAQSFAIKRTLLYIPMLIYSVFVLISHLMSSHRDIALLGFAERFEGTLVLLAYILVLFFAINVINSERDVKVMIYAVSISTFILSLLGISQAIGHDFFQTQIGRMMIIPRAHWTQIDDLHFEFVGQIYQTVYNINYVSFYLTLLIPIFAILLVHSLLKGKDEKLVFKIMWGVLFVLTLFNLVGSASIGGALGLGVSGLVAIVMFRKRLFGVWRKPVILLLVIGVVIIGGAGHQQWIPKIIDTIGSVVAAPAMPADSQQAGGATARSHIDYIVLSETVGMIELSINGNGLVITMLPEHEFWPEITDDRGNTIFLAEAPGGNNEFILTDRDQNVDERFAMFTLKGEESHVGSLLVLTIDREEWVFLVTEERLFYLNWSGTVIELETAETIGFANNPMFGSGRGYIWSRTFPMMRDTLLVGHGADTFAIRFPQNDHIARYNAGFPVHVLVDKPHNMYLHMAIGTGVVSMLAFLAMLGFYFVQSVKLYWRREYVEFVEFVGVGIFLGITGFAFAALVNDSSVSVMPMFYGLFGMGIAINMMIKRANLE